MRDEEDTDALSTNFLTRSLTRTSYEYIQLLIRLLANRNLSHREIERDMLASGLEKVRLVYASFDVLRGGNLCVASVNPFEVDSVLSHWR